MNCQLKTIVAALLVANQNSEWSLSTPITVRVSPHHHPLEIWGLQVSEKRQLFLKTIDSIGGHPETFWNELKETDLNADKVIVSIYQRVMATYKMNPSDETDMMMDQQRESDPFQAEVFEHENRYAD